MDDIHTLAAEPKERAGKGAARAARRDGRIPGVIYGAKKSPVMITLDPQEVPATSGCWPATCSSIR
jgi:large subunit ribosomal protein L25